MKDIFDIIVIGSGPAGLSTSLTANELGLKVLVIGFYIVLCVISMPFMIVF